MALSITVDGQDCDINSIASHYQNEPFPGGLLFEIVLTETHRDAFIKHLRSYPGVSRYEPHLATQTTIEDALFTFLRFNRRPYSGAQSFVLNKLLTVEFGTTYRFEVEGSLVIDNFAEARSQNREASNC